MKEHPENELSLPYVEKMYYSTSTCTRQSTLSFLVELHRDILRQCSAVEMGG